MERKTKVSAGEGKQDLHITRTFELPLELLFQAFADPEIVSQWMGTNVLKMESRKHGSYQYETTNAEGQVVFAANGVIHEFIRNQKITRTFEMPAAPFGVQLEVYSFEARSDNSSLLTVHIIYESPGCREMQLQFPFAQGLSMAHDRLERLMKEAVK